MKIAKWISIVLSVVLMFNVIAPTVNAQSAQNLGGNVVFANGYLVGYGYKDSEKLYNYVVDTKANTVQFAVVYSSNPDYLYERTFDLPSIRASIGSKDFWDYLDSLCFSNTTVLNTVYLPNAVKVVKEPEYSVPSRGTSEDIAFFDDYLAGRFGSEYYDRFLQSTTKNGVTLRQYGAFDRYVYKEHSYLITATITLAGFITGILGLAVSQTLLSVLGFIVGAAGVLDFGTEVYKYHLRANWYKYVTCNNGTYPYSMADKFTVFDGYVYSKTNGRNVDTESESTYYVPSMSYFDSNATQYNAAYNEYLRIGWQG